MSAPLSVVTWNVNSLRVRLGQVLDWVAARQPDVLCLQETKLENKAFPVSELEAAGYHGLYSGQKTYNGVAILSRTPAADPAAELPGDEEDSQRRLLAATIGNVRVLNVYVPNGSEVGSEKFDYKLDWLARLNRYVAAELAAHERLLVVGDFNIAPQASDVYDPQLWSGSVLFSEPERAAFDRLLSLGLFDTFRKFEHPPASFSWWDYRAGAFRRNNGLRIDHILSSRAMYDECVGCDIDKAVRALERPSDHAPVIARFER
jgi:exodeoxyribonuclease-3